MECEGIKQYNKNAWPWRVAVIVVFVIIIILAVFVFLELSTTPTQEVVGRVVEILFPEEGKLNSKTTTPRTMRVLVWPISKFHDLAHLRHPIYQVKLYDLDDKYWIAAKDKRVATSNGDNGDTFLLHSVWGHEGYFRIFRFGDQGLQPCIPVSLDEPENKSKLQICSKSWNPFSESLKSTEILSILRPQRTDVSYYWRSDPSVFYFRSI
jgi:hypothetical protein